MRNFLGSFVIIFSLAACDHAPDVDYPLVIEISHPAGSAARYPFLAEGESEVSLMSWFEPDGAPDANSWRLVWSAYDGESWSQPELIQDGNSFFVNWADFPSLVGGDGAPVAAHWLQKVPGSTYAYHVNMAFRSSAGEWSSAVTPHADLSATEHGFVSMLPAEDGNVFAIWLDGRKTAGEGHGGDSHGQHGDGVDLGQAMTLRSGLLTSDGARLEELEVDSAVCDCCQTSAAQSGKRIIAVYRDRGEGEIRDTYRALYDLDERRWSEPLALSHENWEIAGCPVNGPQVAAFGDTVIATWFSAANGQPRSDMAVSIDGGLTFGEPARVDQGATIGRVGVSLNRKGIALLTWIESGEEMAAVKGRLWSPDGLQPPFVIGEIDASRASGFPQSAGLESDFLVAWTEPEPQAGASGIRVMRLSLSQDMAASAP